MNIIVPLCGQGQRFKEAGFTTPKHLIPVMGKPILYHMLDSLVTNEDDRIFIVCPSPLSEAEKYRNVQVIVHTVPTQGAAETVSVALNSGNIPLDRPTLVIDADAFYTIDILSTIRSCFPSKNAVFSFVDDSDPMDVKYSYVSLAEDNFTITDIVEKKRISDIANTGAYFFTSAATLHYYCRQVIVNNITSVGEPYMSCVIKEMLNDAHQFVCHQIPRERFVCLGTPALVDDFTNRSFAFLFDLDGTIINTDDAYLCAWNDILRTYNMVLTPSMYAKYVTGKSDKDVVATLLPNAKLADISSQKDAYFLRHLNYINLTPGVKKFMESIKEYGHRIAIVTNANRKAAEHIVSHIGVKHLVDHLVIGAECARPKPSGDPYREALIHFNLPPSRAIVFEDSRVGIQSALYINPRCIVGVNATSECDVDIHISSFEDLNILDLTSFEPPLVRDELHKSIVRSLRHNHDIVSVDIKDHKLKGGFIADVLDVTVGLQDGSYLYCVAKMRSDADTMINRVANTLDLHEREYYFYENIANYVNVRTPRCYGLIKNEAFQTIGVLLENMYQSDCKIGIDMNTVSIDVPLKVVGEIAKLHAAFWNKQVTEIFPQLKNTDDSLFRPSWGDFVRNNWDAFKKRWQDVLSPSQMKIGERIVSSFDDIQHELSTGHLTFCHGDVKAPNLFFDEQMNPVFLDWQYITCGKGAQDLMFFIIESFNSDNILRYGDLLKEFYYVKLLEHGVTSYDKTTFLRDCDTAVYYFPFFVAIWFGTMPTNQLLDVNFPSIFIQKLFKYYAAMESK